MHVGWIKSTLTDAISRRSAMSARAYLYGHSGKSLPHPERLSRNGIRWLCHQLSLNVYAQGMHVPKPWVLRIRLAILMVGSAWPVAALLMFKPTGEGLVWTAIAFAFVGIMFGVPAALLSIFIRTYALRIVIVPPALVIWFWMVSGQSTNYGGVNMPPFMMLWIITATAIALLPPENQTPSDTKG